MDIDLNMIRRFEAMSAADEYARAICKKMRDNLPRHLEDIARIRQLYTAFSEGRAFYELKDKGLAIDRVKECRTPTPDFVITGDECTLIYAELKAPTMEGGDGKYCSIMQSGLEKRIESESQLRRGATVAITHQEISPLGQADTPTDPRSIRLACEAIINKARGVLDTEQLKAGPTILIFDIGQLAIPCDHREALMPEFIDSKTCSRGTGVLFAAAFGTVGQPVSRTSEFKGQTWSSGIDGVLAQDGILRQFPAVEAILFRSGWSPAEYLGLVKATAPDAVRQIVIKASH